MLRSLWLCRDLDRESAGNDHHPGSLGWAGRSKAASPALTVLGLLGLWFFPGGAQSHYVHDTSGEPVTPSQQCVFPATQGLAWLGVGWDGSGRDRVMWRQEYKQRWLRASASGVRPPCFDPHCAFVSCVSRGKFLNLPVLQFRFSACQMG